MRICEFMLILSREINVEGDGGSYWKHNALCGLSVERMLEWKQQLQNIRERGSGEESVCFREKSAMDIGAEAVALLRVSAHNECSSLLCWSVYG